MSIWTKDISLSDRQIIDLLLSNDPEFVDSFFKEGCRPLLSKINWKVFNNKLEYSYLYEHFKFYIRQNDWKRLRSFKGGCSLWGWLKITAAHFFYNNRHEFLPELSKPQRVIPERKRYDFTHASEEDVEYILDRISDLECQGFIRDRHVNCLDDSEIQEMYLWSPEKFHQVERKAYASLKSVFQNTESYYECLFVITEEKILEVDESEITVEPSTDETPKTITKIDIQQALSKLDDRDRYVLRSLIIEDRKRADVAEDIGVTPEYLDIIRNRALKKMKNLLVQYKYGRV